jgi:hypothetical protein
MSNRLRSVIVAAAAQYGALALGCFLGGPRSYGIEIPDTAITRVLAPLLTFEGLGSIAALAFSVEALRYFISSRLRQADPATAWLCLGLLIYVGWFMVGGVSLEFEDGDRFVIHIYLLLPFLLAIGPLVRSKAWFGLAGAILFYATALSIIIGNGFYWRSGGGFFYHWIS